MHDVPIYCNIDAIQIEERDRHFDLITQWRSAVQEVVELPTGYAFRIAERAASLQDLAEFVSRERLCCPFFHFEIVVQANEGPLWLRLLGDDEVKSLVQQSLVET